MQSFLKMEAAALIYLKTAAWLCVQLFGRKRPAATTAVFFIPAEQHSFFLLTLSACYLQTNLIFPQLLCQLFLYICKATTNATTNNPMHHMTARNLLLPGSVFRRNIRTESITWAKGRFLTNILVYFII